MRILLFAIAASLAIGTSQPGAPRPDPIRDRARVQHRAGWEYMRMEQFAEAARSFRQAIEIDPEYEDGYYGLGRANMALKRYREAIAAYTKCKDTYVAQAGKRFSSAQEAQRYRRERILEIDEAIRQLQVGPQTAYVAERLRSLQEDRRQQQEFINRGNNITIDASVPANVLLALGSAYFRMERFSDAEREYKAAISANPKSGEAHQNLAVVYLTTQRYTEAERAIDAARKTGFKVNLALEHEIKEKVRME